MMARTWVRVALAIAMLATAGCNAKWNTAFRQNTIPEDRASAITTDAKQRHVLMQPEYVQHKEGEVFVKLRMCAEPAPDVFAAIAASGSALINVDAKTQTGGGQLGIAAAETAASIERTQTINLLRESFFRTCERYLSGAISKESFTVQAGRDARAMVAVLAIEQLTGAIRRPSTIISGPATSAAVQAQSKLADALVDAQGRERKARAAVGANSKIAGKDCSQEPGDKKASCTTEVADAKKNAPDLEAELKAAEKETSQLAEAIKGGADSASASTTAGSTNAGGSADKPDTAAITAVAGTIERLAAKMIEIDDMRLYCIERFESLRDDKLRDACIILLSRAAQFEAERFNEDKMTLQAARETRVQSFLAQRSNMGTACAGIAAKLDLSPSETKGVCSTDPAIAENQFRSLTPGQQSDFITLMPKGGQQ